MLPEMNRCRLFFKPVFQAKSECNWMAMFSMFVASQSRHFFLNLLTGKGKLTTNRENEILPPGIL
jgi:hypothetical protein